MNSRQTFVVEAATASPCWRTTHILLSCIAAIGSLSSLIPFSIVVQKFNGYCPLYAQVTVSPYQGNYSFEFCSPVPDKCWGQDYMCNFCLFTTVCSFIYSFIWLWFFSVCVADKAKNMASLSRPWLVVPPAVVFNFVMTVLIFVASGLLTSGVNSFCEHLDTTLVKGCSRAQDATWKEFNVAHFYTVLVVCQVAMWISSFAWLFGFVVVLLRCCTGSDFKVLKVRVDSEETLADSLSSPGPSTF